VSRIKLPQISLVSRDEGAMGRLWQSCRMKVSEAVCHTVSLFNNGIATCTGLQVERSTCLSTEHRSLSLMPLVVYEDDEDELLEPMRERLAGTAENQRGQRGWSKEDEACDSCSRAPQQLIRV